MSGNLLKKRLYQPRILGTSSQIESRVWLEVKPKGDMLLDEVISF